MMKYIHAAVVAFTMMMMLAAVSGCNTSSDPQTLIAKAQVEIAKAEGELGAARSFVYDTVDDIWQTVVAGAQPTMRQRALCRIAATQATEVAARVARTASTLAGSSSVYNTSSLQRHARDADVITHHFTQSQHVWEDAGRSLLGLEPQAPLF